MKIKITPSFRNKLKDQVEYIAKDKPGAARKFKSDILKQLSAISEMPYLARKSIFFDRDDIRDLIFKGYVIVYKINEKEDAIEIFGFTKYEDNPFNR
jgi:plasmid stabilization system protein ParE